LAPVEIAALVGMGWLVEAEGLLVLILSDLASGKRSSMVSLLEID
jgi:hypothetical protein